MTPAYHHPRVVPTPAEDWYEKEDGESMMPRVRDDYSGVEIPDFDMCPEFITSMEELNVSMGVEQGPTKEKQPKATHSLSLPSSLTNPATTESISVASPTLSSSRYG